VSHEETILLVPRTLLAPLRCCPAVVNDGHLTRNLKPFGPIEEEKTYLTRFSRCPNRAAITREVRFLNRGPGKPRTVCERVRVRVKGTTGPLLWTREF
jgi:hypothetical protein